MYTPLGSFSPEADKAVFVYAEADIMTIFKVDGKDRLKVKSVRKSYPDHMFVLQHTPTVVQAAITDDTHYYSQGWRLLINISMSCGWIPFTKR